MKKSVSLIVFLFLAFSALIAGEDKYDINVIMIGIGAKNPTFDESKFPNLKFYYTPGLVSKAELDETAKGALSLFAGETAREVFEGKPDILAKWWDEMDLRNYALIFDKNGVGTWQGKLNIEDDLVEDSEGEGEESSLEDTFEFLIEDGNTVDFDEDKEFDCEDDDSIIETKLPDFEVVAPDSSKIMISELMSNDKPTMIVFFQISKDVDINAAKDADKEESVGGFLSSQVQSAAGLNWKHLMKNLEFYIFGNEVVVKNAGDKD